MWQVPNLGTWYVVRHVSCLIHSKTHTACLLGRWLLQSEFLRSLSGSHSPNKTTTVTQADSISLPQIPPLLSKIVHSYCITATLQLPDLTCLP